MHQVVSTRPNFRLTLYPPASPYRHPAQREPGRIVCQTASPVLSYFPRAPHPVYLRRACRPPEFMGVQENCLKWLVQGGDLRNPVSFRGTRNNTAVIAEVRGWLRARLRRRLVPSPCLRSRPPTAIVSERFLPPRPPHRCRIPRAKHEHRRDSAENCVPGIFTQSFPGFAQPRQR